MRPFRSNHVARTAAYLLQGALLLLATACSAEQWPAHPLPTKSSEAEAYGQAIKIRPSLKQCLKDSGDTTPGMRDCLNEEHAYQDKRLNQVYRKLMANLEMAERESLRQEERRWIAFRDKFCAVAPDPGQGQELDADSCLVDQTADRATELESRLSQEAAGE